MLNTTPPTSCQEDRQPVNKAFKLAIVENDSDVRVYTDLLGAPTFYKAEGHKARQIYVFTACDKFPSLVGRFFFLGAVNRKPCVFLCSVELEDSKTSYYPWDLGKDYSFLKVSEQQMSMVASNIWT